LVQRVTDVGPVTYPPPLDLRDPVENAPSFVRMGPAFEWRQHEGSTKLLVCFGLPGGPMMWKALSASESSMLLQWMLASASASGQ
jgi:hypothetical protein